MKIGLVGYQGSGKSTVFQLLTGLAPDPARAHTGQVGVATVPDKRFDSLVRIFNPKKQTPARIELFDTPGLNRESHSANAQRLGVIREAATLVQVVDAFSGSDPATDLRAFEDDLLLADLQVVSNRLQRLEKDATKPRPDRDELLAELEALRPIAGRLESGEPVRDMPFTDMQIRATRSFALLTRKNRLICINTADSDYDTAVVDSLEQRGYTVVAAPFGLELEVQALPETERAQFAAEMGLRSSSGKRLLEAIFQVTDLITFYTCDEKEVHAWLLQRGAGALEAADTIHSDLARGFIRAEITKTADLIRLGSEREVKAAGLQHVEGKDYVVQDGDEIVIRFNV